MLAVPGRDGLEPLATRAIAAESMPSTAFLLQLATMALTTFLLAASALAILFPRRPLLGVSQHWGLQLWWLALLAALPALWLRDWLLLALSLAVAAYWSLRLFPRRRTSAAPELPETRAPLRLFSANLLHANGGFAQALSAIAAQEPDIVVLCEATPAARAACRALEQHLPFALDTCVPDGLYGIVILSRFPLTERSRGIGQDPLPRHLAADVTLDGNIISLLAIHPTNPLRLERAHRIPAEFTATAALCGTLRDDLILAGDCNAAGWSGYLRGLERATGLANDGGLRPSWPVWLPRPLRLPLDHVWVRGGLSLRRVRLGAAFGSDHLPLVAEIAVRAAPPN